MDSKPFFSIVMASYLGYYPGAAADRISKFHRAVNSVIAQSFTSWELIIVADGCQMTIRECKLINHKQISYSLIAKQKKWSGKVRNRGICDAAGDLIVYLDTDDMYGVDHLKSIHDSYLRMSKWNSDSPDDFREDDHRSYGVPFDWVYFDDCKLSGDQWIRSICDIDVAGQCGTSNIAHKKHLAWWIDETYLHDWVFINELKRSRSFTKIQAGEYFVAHIPNQYDI